jgi:hypothetical protein
MSDETLRLKAREAIWSGRLSRERPRSMRKSSADACCAICSVPVGELGLALEFVGDGGALEHAVHVDCFAAWELECESSAIAERAADPGDTPRSPPDLVHLGGPSVGGG